MRLLHALSGGDRDQQLRKDEPDASESAAGGMALRRVAGGDEENRRGSPLREVYGEMSVRAEYTGASGEKV